MGELALLVTGYLSLATIHLFLFPPGGWSTGGRRRAGNWRASCSADGQKERHSLWRNGRLPVENGFSVYRGAVQRLLPALSGLTTAPPKLTPAKTPRLRE